MKTVLCFGDSNTWGFDPASITEPYSRRHPLAVRWTGVLAAGLGDGFRIIEEGQNGRTTVHDDPLFPGRRGRDYLMPCLESHRPIDLVILMLGTNDLKATFNVSAGEIAVGAGQLARMILASESGPGNRAPQLLLVCPPRIGDLSHLPDLAAKLGDARERSLQLPAHYRALATSLGCAYLNSQEVVETSALDGIHLDAEAHRRLGGALLEPVRRLLA